MTSSALLREMLARRGFQSSKKHVSSSFEAFANSGASRLVANDCCGLFCLEAGRVMDIASYRTLPAVLRLFQVGSHCLLKSTNVGEMSVSRSIRFTNQI